VFRLGRRGLELLLILGCLFFVASIAPAQEKVMEPVQITSPDNQIRFTVSFGSAQHQPPTLHYSVAYHNQPVMADSELGFAIQDQPELGPQLKMVGVSRGSADEQYVPPPGKSSSARDHYNSARIDFEEDSGLARKVSLEVRVFDDGAAFRYVFPSQEALKSFTIGRELTQFVFSQDATTYPLILDGFQSSYEDEYQERLVSGLHPDWLIALPLLAELPGKGWIAITEADINNYAGMYLTHPKKQTTYLAAQLAPRVDRPGVAVEASAPLQTPWRVLMLGDEPGRLVESNIILNLNESSKIAESSWIKPGKSAWDWWSGDAADNVDFKPGINTATMKHYIDFAAESRFPYMLIDAGWALKPKDDPVADITKSSSDVDLPELFRYAKERNVRIWLWAHWTSVDRYMDEAFPLFEKWGVAGVKIDFMDRDDQWMVDFYRRVLQKAAEHHLMIDFHGAFKPDGVRRTYPNLVTREGVMGLEYSKWSARIDPPHNTTLPFTRMLAGPMDYTPGGFRNRNRDQFVPQRIRPMVLGTRAHELALFVVFESPFEMVADYPEAYKGQRDFDFIRQVPTVWDETRVLNGRPMQFISIARRSGKDWFLGNITNWDSRELKVPLSFLPDGKYIAEIYADAHDVAKDATHTTFQKRPVDRNTVLNLTLGSGGGNAIWIHPAV
jgi:alpha-glucosidase